MKKYIVIMFGFMIVGFGCALTIKANIGMGAWDATVSYTHLGCDRAFTREK